MSVRPYPHALWPRFHHSDVTLLRGAPRALARLDARAAAEAEALLGVRASLHAGAAELWPAQAARAALATPLCALWLEHTDGARALPLLCTLPPELAAALVDRVLGGDGRPAHVAGAGLDDLSLGVLAYLAARLCAASDAVLRVHAPLADPDAARALLGEARVLVWPLALALGGERAGTLRVFVAEDCAHALAGSGAARVAGTALSALPVALCAHAARVVLLRREWAALAPGDVVVPERCALTRAAGGYAGAVELHALGQPRPLLRAQACGNELTIETLLATATGERVMSTSKRIEAQDEPGSASPLGDDVPIELCLEIARFNLPIGELAALTAGDVLSSGRAIGERVALCAAGRVVARGELVDIDGETGMRVLEIVR